MSVVCTVLVFPVDVDVLVHPAEKSRPMISTPQTRRLNDGNLIEFSPCGRICGIVFLGMGTFTAGIPSH